ncbi:hypothetical protein IAE19_01820 [Acinetobacter sp. S40]|uniref:hypothetical protein n=1 Tax=unclassified Acinetobacter TaxID=196816 RepID=UPI00190DF87A|nr:MULTISPECIES: hypothetical protein [unclassified Acinetobacter]MBJ9984179.1 hypothetical protein [Acinetobacter sp. S40]MBK0062771.1 hypothetical protein [Acinetobacter sp. S55]MBK0065652.1 hypothetical protein [Acinetobacter sp. S54]
MILLRILFGAFAICCLIFLVLGLIASDGVLFVIALLFAAASGLVAWEAKQRFHSLFHS